MLSASSTTTSIIEIYLNIGYLNIDCISEMEQLFLKKFFVLKK